MTASHLMSQPEPEPSLNPESFDPSVVGVQFVREYYTLLNKNPSQLHGFYSKDSTCLLGKEGEHPTKYVRGITEIQTVINAQGYEDAKVIISNIDCHPSADNGLLIVVIGEHTTRIQQIRRFVQTFFLAQQIGGFYILNDNFRYLHEEVEFIEEEQSVVPEKKSHEVVKEEETPTVHHEVDQTQEAVVHEVAPVVTETSWSSPKKAQQNSQAIQEPLPPVAASATSSWAELAATNRNKWSGEVSAAKGTAVNVASISVGEKDNNNNRGPREQGEKPSKKYYGRDNTQSPLSVFVRDIPENTSEGELVAVMEKAGGVKIVEFMPNRMTAVVEFLTSDSVERSYSEKMTIKGKSLTVEPRRPQHPKQNKPRGFAPKSDRPDSGNYSADKEKRRAPRPQTSYSGKSDRSVKTETA